MTEVFNFPPNEYSKNHDLEIRNKGHEDAFAEAIKNAFGMRNVQPFIDDHKSEWESQGSILCKLRESSGLTPYQVAKGLGVSLARIKRLEAGDPVSDAMLLKRAYVLYVTYQPTRLVAKKC